MSSLKLEIEFSNSGYKLLLYSNGRLLSTEYFDYGRPIFTTAAEHLKAELLDGVYKFNHDCGFSKVDSIA